MSPSDNNEQQKHSKTSRSFDDNITKLLCICHISLNPAPPNYFFQVLLSSGGIDVLPVWVSEKVFNEFEQCPPSRWSVTQFDNSEASLNAINTVSSFIVASTLPQPCHCHCVKMLIRMVESDLHRFLFIKKQSVRKIVSCTRKFRARVLLSLLIGSGRYFDMPCFPFSNYV